MLAGVSASALLLGVYARGGNGYLLGFVALVPWLLALEQRMSLRATAAGAVAMSVAFAATAFGWFGFAIGDFSGVGSLGGWMVLLLAAPLLQPQLLAFALVRQVAGRHVGGVARSLIAACAWVGCEWAIPKLLGDTLGHGVYPSLHLRQLADLGGAAGISFVLLLVNEGIAAAIRHRHSPARQWKPALAGVAALCLAWLGYGAWRLANLAAPSTDSPTLRVAMVQTNIVDYERLRQERGAYAVVREVLDTHFAMSREGVQREQADALLWSETVYPTTFGHPKSADGAALDDEIRAFVAQVRRPLVFGTYDRDDAGEYNAAAVLANDGRVLGMYRKTRPFPLTEYVPAWLDSTTFRQWLPWTGRWQRGDGARVFPLQLADGREIPVLPLICLDDVDPSLAIDGARQGAQAILGMSNDSWFSAHAQGAQLHLAVASFRSIETRLPQFRVTANGISAVIDPAGTRVATTAIGQPALLTVTMPVGAPARTVVVTWGHWVGPVAMFGVLASVVLAGWGRWTQRRHGAVSATGSPAASATFDVVVLSPALRVLLVLLHVIAASTLAWIGARMLLHDGLQVRSLAQLKLFAIGVALPMACSWRLRRWRAASAQIAGSDLRLDGRFHRSRLQATEIVAQAPWALPVPMAGIHVRLATGSALMLGMVSGDPNRLMTLLQRAGARQPEPTGAHAFARADARARTAVPRWRIDHPLSKFVVFPLLLALPAFRLHQHIAYGGSFGEYHSFGLKAYLLALLIWWSAWIIGMSLYAMVLRTAVELGTLAALRFRSGDAVRLRTTLEGLARGLYFVGAPAWLLWRLLAA